MKTLSVFLTVLSSWIAVVGGYAQAAPLANPSAAELQRAMSERMERTPEFVFIREEAAKLGVKAYLFGGTAASYAHYVRQDLLRERGDKRYPDRLFNYDYTNIFRSTQDLDVVIDGTAQQAEALENILRQKFPHFIGNKGNQWEVRPLRHSRGTKEPILDNPNFMNQHTDSHSTGLIEVTRSKMGDPVVRDARDWKSAESGFLKDIVNQKITYYWSPLHETTNRFKDGNNPPILSVIRVLTKAFQYRVGLSDHDFEQIRKIVDQFDPKAPLSPYVKSWIEKNGKKLFQHASDLEFAWNTLENLGLRKKLIEVNPTIDSIDSLAWLLNREPLRTFKVGAGNGKTAAEIAKDLGRDQLIVAHEARDYLAYESIIRDRSGELNALISRGDNLVKGELAAYGDGFYTRLGRAGARGTGYTIRMEILPTAREGEDFSRVAEDYLLLKNKAAVRVIPESLEISVVEYFRQLAETGKEWNHDDRALLESFKRRTGRSGMVSDTDLTEIKEIVEKALREKPFNVHLVAEWLTLPESVKHLALLDLIFEKYKSRDKSTGLLAFSPRIISEALLSKHWTDTPEILQKLSSFDFGDSDTILLNLLKSPAWKEAPSAASFIEKSIAESGSNKRWIGAILTSWAWHDHLARNDLWKRLLRSSHSLESAIHNLDNASKVIPLKERETWIRDIIASERKEPSLYRLLHLVADDLKVSPVTLEVFEHLIGQGIVDDQLASILFQVPFRHSPDFTRWFKTILDRGKADVPLTLVIRFLPNIADQNAAVEALIKKGSVDGPLARAMGTPPLNRNPNVLRWLRTLAERSQSARHQIFGYVFSNFDTEFPVAWEKREEARQIVEFGLKKGDCATDIAMLLGKRGWKQPAEAPRWLKTLVLLENPEVDTYLFQHRVMLPDSWSEHPEIVQALQISNRDADALRRIFRFQAAGVPIQSPHPGTTQAECIINGFRVRIEVKLGP